jgi:hypothetical protein
MDMDMDMDTEALLYLDFLVLQDGTDRVSQKVGDFLPFYAVYNPRTSYISQRGGSLKSN